MLARIVLAMSLALAAGPALASDASFDQQQLSARKATSTTAPEAQKAPCACRCLRAG